MPQLSFGRDGVLRITRNVRNRATGQFFPLQFPLTAFEERKPGTFLGLLDADIAFDAGLTAGEALTCLKPWAKEVAQLTGCDFAAFLAEVNMPAEAGRIKNSDIVALVHFQEISARADYGGSLGMDDNERIKGRRSYIMKDLKPRISDRLHYEARWEALAFPETVKGFGYPDHPGRSLAHVPVWNLQHLRLKIVGHSWLLDSTPCSEFLSHKEGLFNSDHPDVEVVGELEDGRFLGRRVRLDAPCPTLKLTILDGLVGVIGFSGSPTGRDANIRLIKDSLAESEADQAREASWKDEEGNVDEEEREAAEAEIVAELAAEAAREAEERKAHPFREDDLKFLKLARELEERSPGLLRAPEGLPQF